MTPLPGEVHLADLFEGGMRPVILVSREQLNRGDLPEPALQHILLAVAWSVGPVQ